MKKDTLYLHVGWTKTGTSAIQRQIQLQQRDFLEKGILYPQTLQWPDHSHHPFALSFQPKGSYRSDMSPDQTLEILSQEIGASSAENVLVSSELSPFYFNNPQFRAFVYTHSLRVRVVVTVRRQSELMLSLFNQLVKYPNVCFNGSLFVLVMRNITWSDYFKKIKKLSGEVGKVNIVVIPYGKNIVQEFLENFGVEFKSNSTFIKGKTANPSLPSRCFVIVQAWRRKEKDNASYVRIRDLIVQCVERIQKKYDRYVLFSSAKQNSFYSYFPQSNIKPEKKYFKGGSLFEEKEIMPVRVLPRGFGVDAYLT